MHRHKVLMLPDQGSWHAGSMKLVEHLGCKGVLENSDSE